jgi:endonuclease/exonuclease/phosphatase family metal-dependent hydrolase
MLRRYLSDSFRATSRGFGFTIPADRPMLRIDYIYAGNGITPLRSHTLDSIVSDHRGVTADLSY